MKQYGIICVSFVDNGIKKTIVLEAIFCSIIEYEAVEGWDRSFCLRRNPRSVADSTQMTIISDSRLLEISVSSYL